MHIIRVCSFTLFIILFFVSGVSSQQSEPITSPGIVINLPSRTLELFSGPNLIKVFPIAVGKPSTPTPTGNYSIFEKEVNPIWYPPDGRPAVPSGPYNPLGYRWMGFFPTYGMHGTNAPWAIGSAVSNGCIRLYEQDIEELFELVPLGTPVKVTYDRIKVRLSKSGEASLGIYPDIYGRKNVTLEQVKACLAEQGLNGFLSDNQIYRIINEEADRQITFAKVHKIRLNDKQLSAYALNDNNEIYIPVWTVAAALRTNVRWDAANQLVYGPKGSSSGIVKGDLLFVAASDLPLLFGGHSTFWAEENTLEINFFRVILNGRVIGANVREIDGILAIPLATLTDALGVKTVRTPDKSYWFKDKKLPVITSFDEPYIQITKIYEYFQTYVFWNQQAWTIELTYPFNVKGGND